MNVEVLIGKQASKGAVATKFFRLKATDYNINQATNVVQSNALTGSRFKGNNTFVSRFNVDGGIPLELTAQSLLMLLIGAGFTTNGAAVGGVQAYKVTDSVDNFYTIVMNDKKNGAYEQTLDAKISQLDLSLAVDTFITGTANIIGGTSTYTQTAFAGTIADFSDEQLICLNAVATKAGTDITAKLSAVTFNLNNNLEAKYAINSIYCTEIVEGNADLSATVTYNKFDKALYGTGFTEMIANTSSAITIKLGTDAAKTSYIELVFPKAVPTSNTADDWGGQGSLTQNYSLSYDKTAGTVMSFNAKGVTEPVYV